MLKEFREFAFKGNMLDMAIGIIIGGAFSKLVNSLVSDLVMPVFGYLTAGIDFKSMKAIIQHLEMDGDTVVKPEIAITYGVFIDTFINLLIMAFTLFLFIKLIGKMRMKLEGVRKVKENEEKKLEEAAAPVVPQDVALLTEIRDLLRNNAGGAQG